MKQQQLQKERLLKLSIEEQRDVAVATAISERILGKEIAHYIDNSGINLIVMSSNGQSGMS